MQLPEQVFKAALSWWLKRFSYIPAGCEMRLAFFCLCLLDIPLTFLIFPKEGSCGLVVQTL